MVSFVDVFTEPLPLAVNAALPEPMVCEAIVMEDAPILTAASLLKPKL
jgi:hypothetical protein